MVDVLTANGRELLLDDDHVGPLAERAESSEPTELRQAFERDGYIFVRGLLNAGSVLAARLEILTKYAIIGEVDDRHPIIDGVAGDRSGLGSANMRAFTDSVRTGAHYESVILDPDLLALVGELLGGPATPFTMRWPRLVRPGEGCGFHCDGPYMSRGTDRQLSAWIPLGHIESHEGGLIILEDSHVNPELRDGYLRADADRDSLVWLDRDPVDVQARYGRRWLTATYEPGDVLLFSMNMLHGALDNRSAEGRCRLSTDSRYFAAGHIPDERWNGEDINPHGPGRVFYPGLGAWDNEDFQDEWKYVDEQGRLRLSDDPTSSGPDDN